MLVYLLYILGLLLIYRVSASALSFSFLFWAFTMPVAFAADAAVRSVFVAGILCWGVGSVVANLVTHFRPSRAIQAYRARPVELGVASAHALYLGLVIAFVIAALFSLYYYSQVGISLFLDEVGYERLVRRHATEGSYFFQRMFRVVMPILCLAYFAMRYCEKTKRYYSTRKLLVAIFVTSALLLFTGMRGNLIIFMFTPFLVALGVINSRVKIRFIVYALTLTISGGSVVTALMAPGLPLAELLLVVLDRISSGASDGIWYVVTEDYGAQGPYLGVTYVNDVKSLFYKLGLISEPAVAYGAQLAEAMLGSAYNGEQAAVYFLGELYANFGLAGVYAGSVVMGFLAQLLYRQLLTGRKTILSFGALVYFSALTLPILGGPTISMFLDYSITVGASYIALALSIAAISALQSSSPHRGLVRANVRVILK